METCQYCAAGIQPVCQRTGSGQEVNRHLSEGMLAAGLRRRFEDQIPVLEGIGNGLGWGLLQVGLQGVSALRSLRSATDSGKALPGVLHSK